MATDILLGEQSVAAFNDVIALDPEWRRARAWRGFAYYGLGEYERVESAVPRVG